jgi:hypothetical protein
MGFTAGAVVASEGRGHTRAMRGRPGRGAVIGLVIGALLVAVLIWLPAALSGDFYEFTDPLIFMGLPIITVCVAAGALVGVSGAPVSADGSTGPARGTSRGGRAVIAVVAVAAAALAVGFFLMATGLL